MKKLLLCLAFVSAFTYLPAQLKKQQKILLEAQQKADEVLLQNLRSHVTFLADDKLEGRSAGTAGEKLAMDYISNHFSKIGLLPKGLEGFIQPFTIEDGKAIDPETSLSINGNNLKIHKEYIPLSFSAIASISAMPSMALRERSVPWFLDIKPWLEANKNNPQYNIEEAIKNEAASFATRGASALFVYNSSNAIDNISFNKKDASAPASIPIVYILSEGYKKYLKDPSEMLDITLNVSLKQRGRKGHNVIGYIDNNATNTVVIGAHYDHLGWGDDGGALDTGKIIRKGADDNASGTAALIEIAQIIKKSAAKSNNYLFIAFSGEELGLLGSKYWVENKTISTPVNYMINMDMIGRYDENRKLSIGGYGTSAAWGDLLKSVTNQNLQIKLDSAGSGPGDHATFYKNNIPVLNFFTGTHVDYHTASDVAEKINYEGQVKIVKYVHNIVEASNNKGQLAFLKTAEPQTLVRHSVSLGVMPDYNYASGGLKIEGVSPKKLASKLGLQAGDVLTQLGTYRINDIQTYLQALGNFKLGDKTTLLIKRGKDEKEFNVEF